MQEYRVSYTQGGKGYSNLLPWIWSSSFDPGEALDELKEAREWLDARYNVWEAWVETREITDWSRIDPR